MAKETTNVDEYPRLRVAGVPEHFNEPWQIAREENLFQEERIQIEWFSVKEGTGALIQKLKLGEVDVIVALTEGLLNDIANGSDVRLLGTYVQSPLIWSVSVHPNAPFQSIEDLKGETFGISRYQSGSHLMSCVLANQYGWKQSQIQFAVENNFDNLRKSVRERKTSAFIWEYFMQKPFYDRGELRRIGEIVTPWPCFMIASTTEIVSQRLNHLQKMFVALQKSCSRFRNDSVESIRRISEKYHLSEEDAKAWFDKVNITATYSVAESAIETTIDALQTAHILHADDKQRQPIDYLDRRIAQLTVDIKSMRLYNKPELLISLRNNLVIHGFAKGRISYKDLLPFDQNHYYGTDALDDAAEQLRLTAQQSDHSWIIQIGSNLGGCARYLAGKYHSKVLAIELQNDLSQAANELTERCGLNHQIHHIAGDFLNVAQHLQSNLYRAIVSWLTILHFNQSDRTRLLEQCFRLLQPSGLFYAEDFVRIGNVTNEESQILEHDVFCRYLPTMDEYQTHLIQEHFQIIETNDLTEQWKTFTQQRLNSFQENKLRLVDIHGEEIYERLEYFYSSIVKLFQGGNVGGIRILAKKTTNEQQ